MSSGSEGRVLVIGVGNPLRGDDDAGPAVARRLRAAGLPEGVAVLESDGEPAGLMDAWEGASVVVLVDAVLTGAEPGTVHRFDVSERPLPGRLRAGASTHGLGVGDAIELARALGRLPRTVVVHGIEAGETALGSGPTPAVERAIATVSQRVEADIADLVLFPLSGYPMGGTPQDGSWAPSLSEEGSP